MLESPRDRLIAGIGDAAKHGEISADGNGVPRMSGDSWYVLKKRIDTALAEAEARGYARGLDWQPISESPYGQEVRIQAGEMTFLAMLVKDGSMLEDETPCDQWQATREGEHPPCWSDGACWASNADDCASLQPTGWVPYIATAPAETQKPEETA